jgi:hypothetical protein
MIQIMLQQSVIVGKELGCLSKVKADQILFKVLKIDSEECMAGAEACHFNSIWDVSDHRIAAPHGRHGVGNLILLVQIQRVYSKGKRPED